MCKEMGGQLAIQKHASLMANKVAVELGLDDPNGPSAILTQTMEVLGDRGGSDGSNVVYMYLLNECEKLFDNELDQATFEEHMRWFFGNKVSCFKFSLEQINNSTRDAGISVVHFGQANYGTCETSKYINII